MHRHSVYNTRPNGAKVMELMRGILYKIKKIPNYIGRFGVIHGLRLFFQVERPVAKSSSHQASIKVPGYAAPVHLRATVSDHSAFWICLVAEQYSVQPFPQRSRLAQEYEKKVQQGQRPLIIDAGANIGMSALWYAKTYPKAQIFAIEPNRENYDLLVENTRAYAGQIIPFHGGVWPREVGLVIENPEAGAQHYRTREVPAGTEGALNAITIERILADTASQDIFIAKIDIEGGQAALFADNTAWVEKTNLIVLELDDWQFPWAGTSRSFFSCVSQHPFDYLLNGENIFCFLEATQPNQAQS